MEASHDPLWSCHPESHSPAHCFARSLGHQELTVLPGILPKKSRVFTGSGDQQLCSLPLNLSHRCWCLTEERSRTKQLEAGKEAELFEPLTRLFQGFSLERSASFHFSLSCCILKLLGVTDSWKGTTSLPKMFWNCFLNRSHLRF